MRLIIMGPPGAGKGSQATNIVDTYQIPHISTGDIFRAALKNETPLGQLAKSYMDRGELVPDSVTNDIVAERLQEQDCQKGFLLDGYPRNIPQAQAFDKMLERFGWKVNAVIEISGEHQELIRRIVGRRVCKNCGATFHMENKRPRVEGVCDNCEGELVQRKDDSEETAKNRLDIYAAQTAPLLDYYTKRNLLVSIDGNQSFDKVFQDLKSALDGVS